MSERIDLQEFLSAYLAEAEDHVALANTTILAIEAAAKKESSNPRAIRELFRLLHTIKGLSAMVGVEPIVAIAHRAESILRAADRGTARLTEASVQLVFEALRAIEQRLHALGADGSILPAPAALLARLEAGARAGEGGSPERAGGGRLELDPALSAKLAPFEREQLARAGESGKRALRADFVPSPKKAAAGFTINSVRERLGSVAEIVRAIPVAVPPSEAAPGGLSFVLLMVTAAADVDIAAAAGCEPGDVRSLLRGDEPSEASDSAPPEALQHLSDDTPDDDSDLAGAPSQTSRSLLRVDVARVDEAMDRLSTLLVTRARLTRAVAALGLSGLAARELQAIVHENARQLRDLRAAILRLRMIPFADVLARLPLILRGLVRTSGKEVRLVTQAEGAELDKAVAERVFPALVHLVRNAVDHGVETTDARAKQGKPPAGTVTISCAARSNRFLTIRVADDGRGIDREALARRTGTEMPASNAALLEVLCRPGLSTRAEVTTTSGRGMGMDIVRRSVVEQLGGELSVDTRTGEGTTFFLEIPLTVSILDAFILQCGDQRYAVPVALVEEIMEIDPKAIVRGPRRPGERAVALVQRRGEAVPLVDLAVILGSPRSATTEALEERPPRYAIVIKRGTEQAAFGFDRVVSQQETVVRPLIDPLVQAPGIAGSTDLGDGKPTLVLDLVATMNALGRARDGERGRAA